MLNTMILRTTTGLRSSVSMMMRLPIAMAALPSEISQESLITSKPQTFFLASQTLESTPSLTTITTNSAMPSARSLEIPSPVWTTGSILALSRHRTLGKDTTLELARTETMQNLLKQILHSNALRLNKCFELISSDIKQ